MNPILLESPSTLPSSPSSLSVPELLQDSLSRFFSLYRKSSPDFSIFRPIFFRLINSSPDPPLEVLWFYSAVVYLERVHPNNDVVHRVNTIKDLLHLLITCSVSCNAAKSVAVVAPVVSELWRVVAELEGRGKVKKLWREVDGLVEGVIGYISICGGKRAYKRDDSSAFCGDLLPCFEDLIRVWTVGRDEEKDDNASCLRLFFPLLSGDVGRRLIGERSSSGDDIEYLAGVVTVEAFILRLYLKFRAGSECSRTELGNELKVWVVSSITGFGNQIFFGILLRVLLESNIYSILHLDSNDEGFLRSILYDAVLLVEYSFLHPNDVEEVHNCLRSLAVTRLVISHEAIQAAWKKGDQRRAVFYIDAFSKSSLRSGLTKWITSQSGKDALEVSNATTPQAMLNLLLKLESQCLDLLNLDFMKQWMKSFDGLDLVYDDYVPNDQEMVANDDLFITDNKGAVADDSSEDHGNGGVGNDNCEDHDMKLVDNAFLTAARSMSKSDGRRKRKVTKGIQEDWRGKFVKYKIHDNSAKEYQSGSKKDDTNSESEVEDPLSDEDMQE